MNGIHEVRGSIPLVSTNVINDLGGSPPEPPKSFDAPNFRNSSVKHPNFSEAA